MIEKLIGQKIQALRKKRGLTQEQLAEALDLSKNHLSAIERGVYGVKIDLLVNIMNYLNCSADELFCDVIDKGTVIRASKLSEKIDKLPIDEQIRILDVVETMVKNAKKN